MMLFCPKCGDYYSDRSLGFCLADGSPLISVNPGSESWSEGARIIERKESALRKQKRRRKWRRALSVTTMLLVTMIVYGMAVRRYIYLVPSPSPSPTPTTTIVIKETPTPTIVIKETPTPTIVIRETPSPTIVIKKAPTPTIVIRETPTPTIVIKKTPTPTIVIRETPTPPIIIKKTPTPTRTENPQVCSNADERREEQTIRSYFPAWRRNVEGERTRVIAENVPDGAKETKAMLGEIEFQVGFVTPCKSAAVTARYAWQVSYSLNGTPSKTKTVSRRRTIGCGKIFGMWVCR
jgi:hypothetical protein